jgi:hypothetical protein
VTAPHSILCCALLVSTLCAATADARTCGDADGSGTVTVTDGVQTLRASAGLSSTCTVIRCDVDASDTITVTDGVNVLRKAAGLSAPDACPGGDGIGVDESVDSLAPFLVFGLGFAAEISTGGVAPAGSNDVDACPDGGTRSKGFISPGLLRIGFTACRYSSPGLGRFEFNQGLVVNFLRSQVSLSVLVTDLDSGRLSSFDGFFDFTPRDGGGFVANGQDILLTAPEGQFTLDLNALTVDEDGHVLSGGGSLEDTSNEFALARIEFQVTAPGSASLTATFDDQTTTSYVLNLVTGELTQV